MNLKTKPLTKGELAPWFGCRNIKGMGQFKIKQHKPRMESNPTELDSSDFGHYFIGCFHEHFYIFKKLTKNAISLFLRKGFICFFGTKCRKNQCDFLQSFTCSKPTIETLEKCVKHVQS